MIEFANLPISGKMMTYPIPNKIRVRSNDKPLPRNHAVTGLRLMVSDAVLVASLCPPKYATFTPPRMKLT